jgi:hypothetical protein
MDVDEDVVAVALRRHAHAVIVQVRRLIRQIVAEGDPQGIAKACPQGRRHVSAIVEQAGKFVIAKPHRAGRRSDCGFQNAVAAPDFRRLHERLRRWRFGQRMHGRSEHR